MMLHNEMGNNSTEYFTLLAYYSTLNIEEKIESLEYDLGNFVAAAGGNLGLLAGFSCLSLIFGVIDGIQKMYIQYQKGSFQKCIKVLKP